MIVNLQLDISPAILGLVAAIRARSAQTNAGVVLPAHEDICAWIEAEVISPEAKQAHSLQQVNEPAGTDTVN